MKRILAVDDDSSVLRLLTRALPDYEVTVAQDAGEAWLAARRGKPDLLIADYMMPSIFGDELVARLRAIWPDLRVLMLTAHCNILDTEGQSWWRAEPHMEKPFRISMLRTTVNELLAAPADPPPMA